MTLFITQCPHCNMAFRTSISQLQSADGMVRCGACLKIFAADDHLLPSADLQTVTRPYQQSPAEQDAQNADMLSESLLDEEFTQSDADPEPITEVFTLDLSNSMPGRVDPSISVNDTLWELVDDTEQAAETTIISDAEHLSAENIAAVGAMAEPLELEWQQPSIINAHKILLYGAALLLSLGLMMQYVWYNFDTLSQDVTTRALMQRACALLPCTLSPLIDIRAIRSDNLMVRSHPEIANALSVNLTFHNGARYPQPYPLLDLRFLNVNNELLAARQFTPQEYLGAAFSAQDLMPPHAPVQVALEILDPGSEAINYEVSFSPAARHNSQD
jgi:predicted Zn finger-like uncharacterized protein